ncbi:MULTISPECIES: hypothetical protein [unclassified Streptomyces]|uniref:hypothetical protein n=1 Tax=unclassified Streptomyces TaxID=2593676 RepID=UPI00333441B9
MKGRAAIAALRTYAREVGGAERREPAHWQASDLMTDLLRCFDPDTAALIRHRVARDYEIEYDPGQAPLLPPAD